jgi:hypothetical protein
MLLKIVLAQELQSVLLNHDMVVVVLLVELNPQGEYGEEGEHGPQDSW